MYIKQIPSIIKPFAGDLIFDLPNLNSEIYLTFDDGPHPEITPWVLKQLAASNAKATFFLIAQKAAQYPDIVAEITGNGHTIGLHGFSHLNGWKTKNITYFKDLIKARNVIDSTLFRPPYGKISKTQARAIKKRFSIIMYSHLSADFDIKYSPEQCFQFATRNIYSGSIIVFHDSEQAIDRLQLLLPQCLDYYKSQGFILRPIPG